MDEDLFAPNLVDVARNDEDDDKSETS